MHISIIREQNDSEASVSACLERVKDLCGNAIAVTVRVDENETLAIGDLEMNPVLHTVKRDGKPIELNPLEFRLLEYLLRHRGTNVSREELMKNVWHYIFDPQTNILETCVSRLRSKIRDKGARQIVHTVRSVGYRIG